MAETETQNINLPKHVSIIMDGNRRWAKEKGLPSFEGHREGSKTLEKLMDYSKKLGIECLSAWAFSTENWKRSKDEIDFLFTLARKQMEEYKKKLVKDKIRFVHIGRKDRLPQDILKVLVETEEETKDFTGFTFCLAIDYGGHDEMIRAINKLNEQKLEITPENIEKNLDTASLPQVDLIIRTGGECRLSGFMSWQSEYAELYFTSTYFPNFKEKEFDIALNDFCKRDRRFGGNSIKK